MIKKSCCSRFSLHKFVHLKYLWTQFKNVHLQGPCSLRPCISRPYCSFIWGIVLQQIMLRSNWHNNWTLVTFEKFVYFFIPAWVGKSLLKIGPTFTDFAFKRFKGIVNNKNDDSEASKKIQDHQFWKKTGCTWLKILRYLFCLVLSLGYF